MYTYDKEYNINGQEISVRVLKQRIVPPGTKIRK